MKLKYTAFFTVGMLAVCAPAHAEGFYLQGNAGATFSGKAKASASVGAFSASTDEDINSAGILSVVLGDRYEAGGGGVFALEGEILYSKADVDTSDFNIALGAPLNLQQETFAGLANLKYHFVADSTVSPYVGLGAGYGRVKYSVTGGDDDDSGFVWQGLVGVLIKAGDNVGVDLGVRYVGLPKIEGAAAGITAKIESHTGAATAGLRYTW